MDPAGHHLRMHSLRNVLAAAAVLGLVASGAKAEEHWAEIRSPHFTVVTDGKVDEARKVADEFEQMRYVLKARFPQFRLDPSAPTMIFAARDEVSAGLSQYWRPSGPYGYFLPNWDGNLAIVRLDKYGLAGRGAIDQAYVQSVLEQNAHSLPAWLDLGLVRFYGNLAFLRPNEKQITLGAPAWLWQTLTGAHYLRPSKLMAEHPEGVSDQEGQFRGEAWALVHYMTFGTGMQGGHLLRDYMQKLEGGADDATAFKAVFGDMAAFEAGFRSYLQAKGLPVGTLPRSPEIDPAAFTVRQLPAAEAVLDQGEFDVKMNDFAHGRTLIEKAVALDPKLATGHEELGFLDYDDGKNEQARTEWEQAMQLDPHLYRSLFADTVSGVSFRQQTGEQRAETLKKLQEVIRLNPRFAPAYAKLALLLWWQGNMDEAYRAAISAEYLEPWRKYDQLVGHVLVAEKKYAQAAAIARRSAKNSVGSDRDGAVGLWEQIPAADRGDDPPLTLDLGPNVKAVSGTLTHVECGKNSEEKEVELLPASSGAGAGVALKFTPRERVRRGFADTSWVGAYNFSHFSLCRNVANQPVMVTYEPGADGVNRLLQVDVLEDMPDVADGKASAVPELASASSAAK